MLLSKLVYLCVKNAIYYDDYSFTYKAFLEGKFNGSQDYATNINNVFSPINEAISRLSDLDKIPHTIEPCIESDSVIDLSECLRPVKEVIGLAQVKNNDYYPLPFRLFGANKIIIVSPMYGSSPLYVEYKEDIPTFDDESYNYTFDEDGNETYSKDIDLKNYGINETMCNYIIEYATGKLTENGSNPQLAIIHINRAEQYFDGIRPTQNNFAQRCVMPKYKIGI